MRFIIRNGKPTLQVEERVMKKYKEELKVFHNFLERHLNNIADIEEDELPDDLEKVALGELCAMGTKVLVSAYKDKAFDEFFTRKCWSAMVNILPADFTTNIHFIMGISKVIDQDFTKEEKLAAEKLGLIGKLDHPNKVIH